MNLFIIYYPIWKKALILAWPIILSHIFTTAMRTTDMLLMGLFGPAAVTAVGLGDVWERIVLRIGLGLGTGSISLISQESGVNEINSNHNSEVVLFQVIVTGTLIGIPFILIGWLIPDKLIGLLGAAPRVIKLAAQYLMIIFSAAPFRIISLISSRALQGTGDTKTPMIIGIISNAANILLSIGLALGWWFFPELGVLGVGWGTFTAKTLAALLYLLVFLTGYSHLQLKYPASGFNMIITRQLLKVSIPRILQGGFQSLIAFPFNSLILLFGTEAAAAYHISRRIQQQLMAPLMRAYRTVTTIMTGQKLGSGSPQASKKITKGMLWLTLITITLISGIIFQTAPFLVKVFSENQEAVAFGTGFLRALSIGAPILTFYGILSGLLTGAGNTKVPFYALVSSQFIFKLGLSYLLSVIFNLGLMGVFIGLVMTHIGEVIWVGRYFLQGKWIKEAQDMIEERRENSTEKTDKKKQIDL